MLQINVINKAINEAKTKTIAQKVTALRSGVWMASILFLALGVSAQKTIIISAIGETAAPRRIVVSIDDRKLALLENDQVLRIYSVAVGADVTPSPEGEFTLVSRVENPTYYHTGKVIAPGKHNPLGTRWMGLSQKGFGIHGTNEPTSIGRAASHGCIRMSRQDLEELFTLVEVGDAVQIKSGRDQQLAQIFSGHGDGHRDDEQPTLASTNTGGGANGMSGQ